MTAPYQGPDRRTRSKLARRQDDAKWERHRYEDEIERLKAALRLVVAYDECDSDDGVAMMLKYDEALTAVRSALAGPPLGPPAPMVDAVRTW